MARIFDFGNTFDAYNRTASGGQADGIGILWDWAVSGNDLWNAVNAYQTDIHCSKTDTIDELVAR